MNQRRLSYFLFALIFAVLLSTGFIISLKWKLPLFQLFTHYQNLSPADMVQQLLIVAQSGVAMMVGGLLAIVSLLLQQMVHNNLASDSTLAVDSGAYLAIMFVIVFFPSFAPAGSFWIAFVGALLSLGLVILLALPSKLNPYVLMISGMIVSIFMGSVSSLILVFHSQYAQAVTLWSSGHLYQVNWQPLQSLMVVSVLTLVTLMFVHKPLTLMSLDDEQAKRLGLPVNLVRFLILVLCAMLTAFVVSRVGIVGFVGLGAATLVNAMQIRDVRYRLLLGFMIGGLLLWLTNNLLIIFDYLYPLSFTLPTGSFTGVLGAPLIIWLILKQSKQLKEEEVYDIVLQRKSVNWLQYAIATPCFLILLLVFINNGYGWHFSFDMDYILRFRLGRSLGAMSAGMMLACAGVILQQMTRNPMASPEVLGISSASSLSMVMVFMFVPDIMPSMVIGAGVIGSAVMLAIILWLSKRVNSTYLLLVGISIGALTSAVMTIIMLQGDPKLEAILNWLSGTTYHIHPEGAYILLGLAIITTALSFLLIKPLKLLSLSETKARSLGLSVKLSHTLILTLVAVLSAISTIAIGPLSFIGLMVPQMTRSMGAVQIEKQLPLSIMLGALIMLVADWLGRYIIFPFEIPVGILASVIGGGYFLLMMRKIK